MAWQWTVWGLGNEQLDVKAMGMDVMMATQRWWKRNGNGNEWLGNGRLSNGRRWMARRWMAWQWTARQWMAQELGYGRLDGNTTAMDGLLVIQRRQGNAMAMDSSTAAAMNSLATDGSAMGSTIARWWTAWLQRDSNGWRDGDTTSI
jgi:hypothetical protein